MHPGFTHSRQRNLTRSDRLIVTIVFLFSPLLITPSGFTLTADEENTIAVYEKVAPSIVNITTAILEPNVFFSTEPEEGAASGIILDADGIIVTNYHVIASAENIVVTVEEGLSFKADVLATARDQDVALLRIKPGKRALRPVDLGNSSKIEVGEKVLAVGNPFGLGRTLTTGVVSMTGRDIRSEGGVLRNLIQTDASINPGNSGGGLFNSRGELIGMNTIILSPTGSNIGIGFAIPSNHIQSVVGGLSSPFQRIFGWLLAILFVYALLRRLYRKGAQYR